VGWKKKRGKTKIRGIKIAVARRDQKISLPLSPQLILWVGAGKAVKNGQKRPKGALIFIVNLLK
jgi:hypothetical protein